jgi:hypothetical protein
MQNLNFTQELAMLRVITVKLQIGVNDDFQ